MAAHWKARTGDMVTLKQSMAARASMRSVIDGLEDDMVTLALAYTSMNSPTRPG